MKKTLLIVLLCLGLMGCEVKRYVTKEDMEEFTCRRFSELINMNRLSISHGFDMSGKPRFNCPECGIVRNVHSLFGETHAIDICENCYIEWVLENVPEIKDLTE